MSEVLPKRQGDIRLVPVDNQPLDDREYTYRERGEGLIIAAGEATGHHHRVRDSHTRLFERNGKMFLHVSKNGAALEHEEHATIDLEPGTFEIVNQRELIPPPTSNPTPQQMSRTTRVWD